MTLSLLDGVTLDEAPVVELYPGWAPTSRHEVVSDFSVIVFSEEAGEREACWWLKNGAYSASHALSLDTDSREHLLGNLNNVFWPLWEGAFAHTLPETSGSFLESLPEVAVNELAGTWLGSHAPHTLILPSGHADSGEALVCPNGVTIGENRVSALLAAKTGQGPLIVSSPFSALPLRAQLTFITGTSFVSRFQDRDAVFYLIWNEERPEGRPSFYYPSAPLLISDDPMAALIPGLILGWFARNPSHIETIRNARPFRAEDFGVGQASGLNLNIDTPPRQAAEIHNTTETSTAPHAMFAPQPSREVDNSNKTGWKNILKSFFSRR